MGTSHGPPRCTVVYPGLRMETEGPRSAVEPFHAHGIQWYTAGFIWETRNPAGFSHDKNPRYYTGIPKGLPMGLHGLNRNEVLVCIFSMHYSIAPVKDAASLRPLNTAQVQR